MVNRNWIKKLGTVDNGIHTTLAFGISRLYTFCFVSEIVSQITEKSLEQSEHKTKYTKNVVFWKRPIESIIVKGFFKRSTTKCIVEVGKVCIYKEVEELMRTSQD